MEHLAEDIGFEPMHAFAYHRFRGECLNQTQPILLLVTPAGLEPALPKETGLKPVASADSATGPLSRYSVVKEHFGGGCEIRTHASSWDVAGFQTRSLTRLGQPSVGVQKKPLGFLQLRGAL